MMLIYKIQLCILKIVNQSCVVILQDKVKHFSTASQGRLQSD